MERMQKLGILDLSLKLKSELIPLKRPGGGNSSYQRKTPKSSPLCPSLPPRRSSSQVHPKNWYPIPLIFCRPWGKLPENVPCHPKLADFANFMKKKSRGMSMFVSILDGDYHECAEDAKAACRQLSTYIEYKRCEGVAEIVVAPNMSEGFRGIVQTMGLGNLKPNIVVMRYPEIWRRENLIQIPTTFVGIISDCIVANKAVVIVKGLDEWPNEYQRQYGTIDLYWIVRDGGLMLLLSQLLLTKESFESCKIQVFCIAEEDAEAEDLKADVKKFLYDPRMQAETQKETSLKCLKCLENENKGEGEAVDDLKLKDSKDSGDTHEAESWTDAETLLLLESVLKHGDNWNLVAQNVQTKKILDCISKLIQLPFGDLMLSTVNGMCDYSSSNSNTSNIKQTQCTSA